MVTVPAWWAFHEGHLAHLVGSEQDYLLFRYPLRGTFEFSADTYPYAIGYDGLVFEPSNGQIVVVGHHDSINRPQEGGNTASTGRLTIQVQSDRVRCLIDGQLFYEEKDPAPTSPWLTLFSSGSSQSHYRGLRLHGTPEIPREVPLSHGSRLDGWLSSAYAETQPPRLARTQQGQDAEDEEEARGRYQQRTSPTDRLQHLLRPAWDWSAKDGEILGRRNDDPDSSNPQPSLLTYFRPLRPGETLRYEFFCKPGETMVHPSLGRLVFLLEPERIRLHWLTAADSDWTGLAVDNASPQEGDAGKPLPLRDNAWNSLRITLDRDEVKLELNGTAIYSRKLEPNSERVFGLFHYKERTGVRVRNVVLSGDWPEKLAPTEMADLLDREGGTKSDPALRRVIGEANFLAHERRLLDETKSLSAEQRYAQLLAWVFPTEEHPCFQLSGHFTPTDALQAPAPPGPGLRLHTGGTFEAPVLELLAKGAREGPDLAALARVCRRHRNDDPARAASCRAALAGGDGQAGRAPRRSQARRQRRS
jgi:hypothetical protein